MFLVGRFISLAPRFLEDRVWSLVPADRALVMVKGESRPAAVSQEGPAPGSRSQHCCPPAGAVAGADAGASGPGVPVQLGHFHAGLPWAGHLTALCFVSSCVKWGY